MRSLCAVLLVGLCWVAPLGCETQQVDLEIFGAPADAGINRGHDAAATDARSPTEPSDADDSETEHTDGGEHHCSETAECDGEHPYCDLAASRCVECLTDAHCTSSGSGACDTDPHECVECLTDDHCTSAGAGVCDSERSECVECLTDDHCTAAGAGVCDSGRSECVECVEDSQCPSGGTCKDSECR